MVTIVQKKTLACAGDRRALWTRLADTDRLNAIAGLGQVDYQPTRERGSAHYRVRTWIGPLPATYDELPFEWIANERWSIRRVVHKNVVKEIRASFHLADRGGGGTDVTCEVGLDLSPAFLKPVGQIAVGKTIGQLLSAVKRIDRDLAAGTAGATGAKTGSASFERAALARARTNLAARASERARPFADRLCDLIANGDDFDLTRIRPYELAEKWKAPRRNLLELCLYAVHAGLLELSWDIVCPSCRTAAERLPTLADLDAHAGCELCDISFDPDLARSVEATFRPARGVRTVEERRFCTGGPALTPHVLEQALIPDTGTLELPAPSEPGRYRVFVRGGASAQLEVEDEHPEQATATIESDTIEGDLRVRPGGTVEIRCSQPAGRHVKIERLEWARRAATAYDVSCVPEFRDTLSTELLRPDVTLSVERATLLFTDLRGSTAFYSRVGDAVAFAFVHDHFELIRDVIDEQRGAIVKTIGDAVMACFADEAGGVRAALELQRRFVPFLEARPHAADVGLKIGLYSGPAYAVTANDTLDYFGQTVNTAARVEGQADSGEVIMTARLAERALGERWVEGCEISERFQVTPKGLTKPLTLARLRLK